MADFETAPTQEFVDQLDLTIRDRIAAARPVERLGLKPNILLQVVEEPDGNKFVTRSFSRQAVDYMEREGQTFDEAWVAMQDIFGQAAIPLVRTGIAINETEQATGYPIVMVSEYLPDAQPLIGASTQTKVDLAKKLPGLFRKSDGRMISAEVFRADMFKVVSDESANEQAVMIDVDPHMIRPLMGYTDPPVAFYVQQLSELMWDEWCTEEERTTVIPAFITAVAHFLGDKLDDIHNPATQAFMNAHLMSNGVDSRVHGLRSR
jgi:hypothetical protein